jgi:hypothetical protein
VLSIRLASFACRTNTPARGTVAHRLELGQVSKDLGAVARQALAVDRALEKLADERVWEARDKCAFRTTP